MVTTTTTIFYLAANLQWFVISQIGVSVSIPAGGEYVEKPVDKTDQEFIDEFAAEHPTWTRWF